MERIDDIKKYLAGLDKDQFLMWQVFEAFAKEQLSLGFNGRATISFQAHRLGDLKVENFIAGTTSIAYNFIKSQKALDNLE